MVDIFTKRDGPRPEDVKAGKLLSDNAATIRKLADQISNGGYSRMQKEKARRQEQPKPDGLIIHDLKARPSIDVPEPYVKISLNNRVVLVDKSTGRQLALLGEIRGNFLGRKFVLATRENGFISPLEEDALALLAHLDGAEVTDAFTESALAEALETLLVPRGD